MVDPESRLDRRKQASGVIVEELEEETFCNMSPWRNLVRALEMRNHEKLNTHTWHDVCYPDPHPADMT
eukprot:2514275-Amphidinium_carterae.1